MKSFFEWFQEQGIPLEKPWVILGKGPSYAQKADFDLSNFYIMSLNHVVREQPVTVAHMIDYDVVDACGTSILENAQVLVMPWHPHIQKVPTAKTLADLTEQNPILKQLRDEGRLLWYNASTTEMHPNNSPVVKVRFFSAEAALNLLAMAGVKQVRSLGVDGGATYSQNFQDLNQKTLLANGHQNFDRQFAEIAEIILRTGVDYAPLDIEAPVRVYVGCTASEMLPVKVLEYSIKKHASLSVTVFPMHLSPIAIPVPREAKNKPRTPFSFQRFLIPALAGYHGRAIYMDSDMQVFQDIRKLWTIPFNGADLLAAQAAKQADRRPQFSVMLLDCAQLQWDITEIIARLDSDTLTYEALMQTMCVAREVRRDIPAIWNSLERYERKKTALLHYTDMPSQPWVSTKNRYGTLWVQDLLEAISAGFISEAFVAEQVQQGFVRPSLLYQVQHRFANPAKLSKAILAQDHNFVAPYQQIQQRVQAAGSHTEKATKGFLAGLFAR